MMYVDGRLERLDTEVDFVLLLTRGTELGPGSMIASLLFLHLKYFLSLH